MAHKRLEVLEQLGLTLQRIHITNNRGKAEGESLRYHAYWRVQGVSLKEFSGIQLRLIKLFGSDKSINDLPRILRVPGFPNKKYEPSFLVQNALSEPVPESYSREEFLAALDKAEANYGLGEAPAASPPASQAASNGDADDWRIPPQDPAAPYSIELENMIYEACKHLHAATKAAGTYMEKDATGELVSVGALGNYDIWTTTVGLGIWRLGWGDKGKALFHKVSKLAEKYNEKIAENKWNDDLSKSQLRDEHNATYVTILNKAREAGWTEAPGIEAALRAADKKDVVKLFCRLALTAKLSPTETKTLETLVGELSGADSARFMPN